MARKWMRFLIVCTCTFLLFIVIFLVLPTNDEDDDLINTNEGATLTATESHHCNEVIKRHNISMKRFAMALSYWEQLTMATTSLCQLAQFSKGWRARTVKPFTTKAELWSLPSKLRFGRWGLKGRYEHASKLQLLDSLYNMTLFNSQLLCKVNEVPPLAEYEDFICKANRTIVLLHFSYNGPIPYRKIINNKNYINCLDTMVFQKLSKIILKFLNKEAVQRKVAPFRVGQTCCINHRHIMTSQELAERCGFSNQESLTVIVTVWRGYSHLLKKTYRLVVPKKYPYFRFSPFPLSNSILSNVSAYHNDILMEEGGQKEFIAVHFRTAKLGMLDYLSGKTLSTKCFNMTWEIISQLRKNYTELPIKYFIDYGQFGSHSFEIKHGKRVSKRVFKERNIVPLHYDPFKYGGIADQGFVALVEQSTIAKAKVLVLVGGGSYQDHIQKRFFQDKKIMNKNKYLSYSSVYYEICWSMDSIVANKKVL